MANKKINELSVRTPSLSDLMLVGDPSTGYSYKATISSLSTLLEANIALNDLSDVVISSVANGNLLAYNGTNWVNRTLGAYLGGTITQYVRGDGSLGDFAGGGGGGGASVSYYLNGSVNQGTFSGNTYYEMYKSAIVGAGTNFTINANGYIASFITDAGDPALLKIPGGNWNLEFYFSASSGGGTPSFYVELYKYDGTTFTLITSSSGTPEGITNGTAIDAYFTSLSVPETVLTLTDRLAIRVYVTHSGRTITLHTENSHLCQIITTFTTGLTALNNLTAQVQFFATGTSGTDFAISSTTATHTFNLPTASATNRGALSSADWTTFNGKVGGSGTTNYVSKFTASGTIGNSQIFDNGTSVGIGTATPTGFVNLNYTNTDYTNTNGANSHILLTNPSSSGQNSVTSYINGAVRAKWRTDVVGNINWVSYANSGTLGHYFYVNGDYGVGKYQAVISNTGTRFGNNLSISAIVYPFEVIGKSSFSDNMMIGTTTDGGQRLQVVGGDANINGLTVGKGGGSVAGNTAVGFQALNATATGVGNNGFGYQSLQNITSGTMNVALGYRVLTTSTTGASNIGIGGNSSGDGTSTLFALTTGTYNVAIGGGALKAVTTSTGNTAVGYGSGLSVTGEYNALFGYSASENLSTGNKNIVIGFLGARTLTTGSNNIILGNSTDAFVGNGITTGSFNTIIGSQITGLSSSLSNTIILADGQGNQRLYINSSGNVGIGTTSPSSTLELYKSSGANYLYITNGTSGTNNGVVLRYNSVDYMGMIGTFTTGELKIGGFNSGGYFMTFYSNNAERMRLTPSGRLLIGTTTESTHLLDVNGTSRVSGTATFSGTIKTNTIDKNDQNNPLQIYTAYNNINAIIEFWGGTGARLQYNTNTRVLFPSVNADISIGTSSLKFNNIYGTNGYFDTVLSVGTTSPNASSILDLTSTTKGFLPPRMTGAQAEAIGTPAAGLMVYSTDGSGATITSLGWWGYNGTTWVKLN